MMEEKSEMRTCLKKNRNTSTPNISMSFVSGGANLVYFESPEFPLFYPVKNKALIFVCCSASMT
jgi:hypothetical protein